MRLTHLPRPALVAPDASPSLDASLVLRQVTDRAWQVCDDRKAPQTPGHLLGFIEQTRTGVELMQVGHGFIWTGFATLDAALAHVAATASITATQRATGDLAWVP